MERLYYMVLYSYFLLNSTTANPLLTKSISAIYDFGPLPSGFFRLSYFMVSLPYLLSSFVVCLVLRLDSLTFWPLSLLMWSIFLASIRAISNSLVFFRISLFHILFSLTIYYFNSDGKYRNRRLMKGVGDKKSHKTLQRLWYNLFYIIQALDLVSNREFSRRTEYQT